MDSCVVFRGPVCGGSVRVCSRLPSACSGEKEKVRQTVSHLLLLMRELVARAWKRVDCMKDSTCRRAVGGGEGGHCVWGASVVRKGSREAREEMCGALIFGEYPSEPDSAGTWTDHSSGNGMR